MRSKHMSPRALLPRHQSEEAPKAKRRRHKRPRRKNDGSAHPRVIERDGCPQREKRCKDRCAESYKGEERPQGHPAKMGFRSQAPKYGFPPFLSVPSRPGYAAH